MDEGLFIEWSPDPFLWLSEDSCTSLSWLPFVRRGGVWPWLPFLRRATSIAVCAGVLLAAGKLACVVVREIRRRRKSLQNLRSTDAPQSEFTEKQDKPELWSRSTSPLNRTLTIIPSPAKPVTVQAPPVSPTHSTSSNTTLQPNPGIPPVSSDPPHSDTNLSLDGDLPNTLETSEFSLSFTDDGGFPLDGDPPNTLETSAFSLSFTDNGGDEDGSLEYVEDSEDEDHTPTEESDRPPEVLSRVLVTIL